MKKIFTAIIMATLATTGFAQTSQEYFRVEFNLPIVPTEQSNSSVPVDYYTYKNPEHQYLDFPAGGNLLAKGTAGDMSFRTTTGQVTDNSYFYLDNARVAGRYPYQVDNIEKITAYSLPVETITVDSTATHEVTYLGDNKTYRAAEFTFNRLPRNVAELKTLMVTADGKRCEAANNPLFVAAVMCAVCPRLLDCSQDCREMIDFLYGTQYDALQTSGIANNTFQNICTSQFAGSGGKDVGGGWLHNILFSYFSGATPSNKYKPNNSSYTDGPFTVRIAWDRNTPTNYSAEKRATIAYLLLLPNPEATTVDDMGFEAPRAVKLRSTNSNGWFFHDGISNYFMQGKAQYDFDF